MPIKSIYLKEKLIGHVNMASCNCQKFKYLGEDICGQSLLYDPQIHSIPECKSGDCDSSCCQPDCKTKWPKCAAAGCCNPFDNTKAACDKCTTDSKCISPPTPAPRPWDISCNTLQPQLKCSNISGIPRHDDPNWKYFCNKFYEKSSKYICIISASMDPLIHGAYLCKKSGSRCK